MRRLLCWLFGHAYPLEPEWLPDFVWYRGGKMETKRYRYRCKRCGRVTDGPILSRRQ